MRRKTKKKQEAISRQLSASLPLPGKYYKYQLTQEKKRHTAGKL